MIQNTKFKACRYQMRVASSNLSLTKVISEQSEVLYLDSLEMYGFSGYFLRAF